MQRRLDFLDVARGGCILLVVAAHARLLPDPGASWIYEFYMPLFFVVAGYLCGRLDQLSTPAAAEHRLKKLAGDYFKGSGSLFLLWFVLYPLRKRDFASVGRVMFSILFGRFTDPANPLLQDACWTGPLWFLTLMVTSQALLFLLLRLDNGTLPRRLLLSAALLAAAQLLRLTPMLFPWCLDTMPMAALLMLVASWFGRARWLEGPWNAAKMAVLAISAAVFVLLHDTYDLHLRYYGRWAGLRGAAAFFGAGFCGSLLFLFLCRLLARLGPLCRLLGAAGRNSLPIFIGHTFLIWAVDGMFLRLPAFFGAAAVRGIAVLLIASMAPVAAATVLRTVDHRLALLRKDDR